MCKGGKKHCAKNLDVVTLTIILSSEYFRGNVIGSTTESACCITGSQSLLQKQQKIIDNKITSFAL